MATPTPPRPKPSTPSTQAELVLLPTLKSCLVNLPSTLVTLLLNSNALTQNVGVEITYRALQSGVQDGRKAGTATASAAQSKSVFVGWTGMQSQTRLAPLVGREGIAGVRGRGGDGTGGAGGRGEGEMACVEMDATFGRMLGLSAGMKVGVSLHLDPPQAHTVNIEPLTATDWEIIELHARFLEMNFLSQVRTLPNPTSGYSHPLTLHLTPTSTANINVVSLTPPPSSTQAFVKIAPDAEVIVAPKSRETARPNSSGDARSLASASRRSAGGRSSASTRHRSGYSEEKARPPLFLRGVTRSLRNEWLDDEAQDMKDEGLKVWLDREHLLSKTLRGVTWVAVTVIKPGGLQESTAPTNTPGPESKAATKIVARLCPWEDAPDSSHVALSSLLCEVAGSPGLVGGIVRIDPAPTPLPRTPSAMKDASSHASKDSIVKTLRIAPFAASKPPKTTGFKFGGESKAEKEEAVRQIKDIFGKELLEGPLTDGMLLPARDTFPGGILDFEPTPPGDATKTRLNWLNAAERKLDISMRPVMVPLKAPQPLGEPLPSESPAMVGIDALLSQVQTSLQHSSSVLLTGGLGSGRSTFVQRIALQLRNEYLFNTIYLPCRTLVSEETRVKTIKEVLHRAFATASWGARLGGRSLVILDDLDRLCPVETELQVDANGRSKQVSELLCSTAREFCGRDSGVVLLATAQSKESLNNVVVGGHVVRDILALKAPNKDGRRQVLQMLVGDPSAHSDGAQNGLVNGDAAHPWMDNASEASHPAPPSGVDELRVDPTLDLLEIAGQTDGYMPGDLTLLISRARNEALIRVVNDTSPDAEVLLTAPDFAEALKGFTPASLRGVTLQSSTTTFASIGGLKETRQTLLETLQYPTTYAPLFAKCPLRLRSGLLLYGYPGCGKTLLASAVAGECGLNFISVKGPEILNKYIGASEKSVRDLFERAEAAKPCVLFFDEFDSIAPKRGHDSTGVTDRVVNMLLTMMDGAEGLSGVYVLAATSRPDLIDPALLRPGRLDKSLICDMPDEQDRLNILRSVSAKLHIAPSINRDEGPETLAEIARRTDGYSGADLQAILYNAHLEAIHDILGDGTSQDADNTGRKQNASSANGTRSSSKAQDFIYFRHGDVQSSQTNSTTTAPTLASLAAERAQIAASLAALQSSRRKARQLARQQITPSAANSSATNTSAAKDKSATPTITWPHILSSLSTTRASVSAQERQRLSAIYDAFVSGRRKGEMSDGQGSMDVGGRTSLM